jgi:integrase
MEIRTAYQSYRKKPFVARWSENGKSRNRFFATEKDRTQFIESFQLNATRQDASIPLIEPRKLIRWQEAVKLDPSADPVEVYRFWLQRKPAQASDILLSDASRAYLRMMVEVGRDVNYTGHARKALEDFRGEVGDKPIHTYDAEAFREHLYGLPYTAVTIRHRRSHLLCAFAWWVEQGWLSENPVEKVKRPQVVTDEPGILSVDDMARLFRMNQRVDPEICGLLALGAFAGMRTSAIAKVDYEEIDFVQRGILTPASKTKKRRRQWIEGLPDNLWKWLKHTPKEAFSMDQRQILHRRAEAYKRAGLLVESDDIAYENRKRQEQGKALVNWKPKFPPKNCLRHSFATYHVALHRDPGKTALILSHRNQEVLYQHYLGIATQEQAERYFNIVPKGR